MSDYLTLLLLDIHCVQKKRVYSFFDIFGKFNARDDHALHGKKQN